MIGKHRLVGSWVIAWVFLADGDAKIAAGAEPGEPPPRVLYTDILPPCSISLTVFNGLIDEAGEFDGDELSDAVLVLDDHQYYLLYGQKLNLWGTLVDSRAMWAEEPKIRKTLFKVAETLPSCITVGGGGDVNGDPWDDVVIGAGEAVTCSELCTNLRVDKPVFYLIFGQEGGLPEEVEVEDLVDSGKAVKLIPPRRWMRWSQTAVSVEFAGDMTGDGYGEVAIATRGSTVSGDLASGGIIVVFGGRHLRGTLDLSLIGRELPGILIEGGGFIYEVGASAAGLGDVDADGFADLALTMRDSSAPQQAKSAYILYGGEDIGGRFSEKGLPLDRWAKLYHCSSPGPAGDIDGDGIADFFLGWSRGGWEESTYIMLLYGGARRTGIVEPDQLLSEGRKAVFSNHWDSPDTPSPHDLSAGGKDLNGDGIPDFLFGGDGGRIREPGDEWPRLRDFGAAHVILGRRAFPEGRTIAYKEVVSEFGLAIFGTRDYEGFCTKGGMLGDFDGDGIGEMFFATNVGYCKTCFRGAYIVPWSCLSDDRLSLRGVDPSRGTRLGGTRVTILGAGFGPDAVVVFGGAKATIEVVLNSSAIVVKTPAHALGRVDVTVSQDGEVVRLEDAFTFEDWYTPAIDVHGMRDSGVEFFTGEEGGGIRSAELIPDVDGDGRGDIALIEYRGPGWAANRLHLFLRSDELPERVDLASEGLGGQAVIEGTADCRITALLGAGDISGDGKADLVVRSWDPGARRSLAGIVLGRGVFPERSTLMDLGMVRILRGMPECEEGFPSGARVVSDLDGDGIGDLLMADESCSGGALLVYGSPSLGSGPEIVLAEMIRQEGALLLTLAGSTVTGVDGGSDLDRDGRKEVVLSTLASVVFYDVGGRWTGEREVKGELLIGRPCAGYEITNFPIPMRALSLAGDLDGDGWEELGMGTAAARLPAAGASGALNVVSSAFTTEGEGCTQVKWWTQHALELTGYMSGMRFGCTVRAAGDWNGDGLPDLLVGAPGAHGIPLEVEGSAYLLFGREDFFARPPILQDLRGDGIRFWTAERKGWLGEALSAEQDVDGDGLEDLLLIESEGRQEEAFPRAFLVFGQGPSVFIRGDVNDDRKFDLSDPVLILNHLFADGEDLRCADAADVNDDGALDIGDPIYILNWLFGGGPEPKPPHPGEGGDPTPDGLGCA